MRGIAPILMLQQKLNELHSYFSIRTWQLLLHCLQSNTPGPNKTTTSRRPQGNPVCREVEYRFTVLAYIKNITYHDYATVDPAEVTQVRQCYSAGPLKLRNGGTDPRAGFII